MPVDRQTFRSVMGAFPTGVVIVATVDGDGSPKGLTTQSLISLSTEPPLLLVSIDKAARTLGPLRHTGAFVVNFLASGSEDLSTLFASKAEQKFDAVRWQPSQVAKGSPVFTHDSVACAECIVTQSMEAGDHWIFIASVEGATLFGGTPLMYYRRTYANWPEEKPAPREL